MELHLKLQIILEIYAILCLVGLPIVLCVAVYLYRKTDVIARIDEWLDTILGPPKYASRTHPAEQPSKHEEADREREMQKTLPRFVLHTGETYKCCRTKNSFQHAINSLWESGYPFIGDVSEEDSVFKALHTGVCTIYFDGIAKFEIEVLPRKTGWFSDRDIEDILNSSPISDVKSRLINADIIQTDAGDRPLIYSEPYEGTIRATFTQGEGTVERVLYEVHNGVDIEKAMDERFMRIPSKGEIALWYHLDSEGYADAVAFLRRDEGKTLIGISRAWRTEMEQAEVKLNLPMVERCFTDLTGLEPIAVSLTDEERLKLEGSETRVTETSTDSMAVETEGEYDGDEVMPEESEIHEVDETASGQFDPESGAEIDVPEESEDPEDESEPNEEYIDTTVFVEAQEADAAEQAEETGEAEETEEAREGDFYDSPEEKADRSEIPEFDF